MRGKKVRIDLFHRGEDQPLHIVADPMMASGVVGEGRFVPWLIVDASGRPDLHYLVRVQTHFQDGEATTQWGPARFARPGISLLISFTRPAMLNVFVEFELPRQGGIVEMILLSEALYLQPGKHGDTAGNSMEEPRIMVEVPRGEAVPACEKLIRDSLVTMFREKGLGRQEAKDAAFDMRNEWRKIGMARLS